MLTKVTNLAVAMLPPDHDAPEEAVRRWRFMVWLWLSAMSLAMSLHIAWACSLLPGLKGFAMAADMQDQVLATQEIRAELLEARIFDTRLRHCGALKEGNRDASRFYLEKLQGLVREYRKVTGRDYPLPDCSEV